jgi:hypothetical protein
MKDETMGKLLQFTQRVRIAKAPAEAAAKTGQLVPLARTSPVTGIVARVCNGLPVLYLQLSRELTLAEQDFTRARVRGVTLRWHTHQIAGRVTWHHLGSLRPLGRIELGDTARASLSSWLLKAHLPSGPGINCDRPPIAAITLVKTNGTVKTFTNPSAWTRIPQSAQGAP